MAAVSAAVAVRPEVDATETGAAVDAAAIADVTGAAGRDRLAATAEFTSVVKRLAPQSLKY